jgi:AraC-like DNA-binding protein
MSSSSVRAFTDPDAYHAAIRYAQVEGIVTGCGKFRAELTRIRFNRIVLQRSKQNLARVSYSAIDPKIAGVLFLIESGPPLYVNGLEAAYGDIVVYATGSAGHYRSPAACQWGAVALPLEDLAAAGNAIIGRELTSPPLTQRITPPPLLLSRLLALHQAAGRLAKTASEVVATPEVARAMDEGLVEALVRCLAGGGSDDRRGIPDRRSKVMRRLEEALHANHGRPLYAAELCAAAGVSYPTLRACCQEHLGMSPKRYLLLRRMHLARRALQRADPQQTTVTRTATDHGFWELGRFSVLYRSLFGETPGATLRRPPAEAVFREAANPPWDLIKSA